MKKSETEKKSQEKKSRMDSTQALDNLVIWIPQYMYGSCKACGGVCTRKDLFGGLD